MIEGINQLDQESMQSTKTLFKPDSWFAKIDFINHLILFNNVIITVSSEKEGGKTSFCSLLQNNLDQQIQSYATKPNSKIELLQEIAQHLGLEDQSDLSFDIILSHINAHKTHMLLIIDDAHKLPHDFLKEILDLIKRQGDFSFLHICLISDHSMVSILSELSDKPLNDFIHHFELSSLNEEETRTYVMQRLKDNEALTEVPTEQQLKQFYQMTKGNLSKINSKLESFIKTCGTKKEANKIKFIQRAAILVVAVFVLKVSFWHFGTLPVFKQEAKVEKGYLSYIPNIPEPVYASKIASIPFDAMPLVSQIPSCYETSQIVYINSLEPISALVNKNLEQEAAKPVALIDKVIVIPKLKSNQNKWDKAKLHPYTIQLLASHEIKDLQQYKRQHAALTGTKIRQFTNNKGLWYVLIMGEYKNKKDAEMRIKDLPFEVAHFNPWVRSTSELG